MSNKKHQDSDVVEDPRGAIDFHFALLAGALVLIFSVAGEDKNQDKPENTQPDVEQVQGAEADALPKAVNDDDKQVQGAQIAAPKPQDLKL